MGGQVLRRYGVKLTIRIMVGAAVHAALAVGLWLYIDNTFVAELGALWHMIFGIVDMPANYLLSTIGIDMRGVRTTAV